MRLLILSVPLALLAGFCPCDDEGEESEAVPVLTPEQEAVRQWYAEHPQWSCVEGVCEPRTADAASLHEAVEPGPVDDVVDGLLVCRVSVSNKQRWDTFGAPEPSAGLTIAGALLRRTAYTGESGYNVYLGWPNVTIHKGDELSLYVLDKDVGSPDYIGEATSTWTGMGRSSIHAEHFDADCRVIPPDVVAAGLELGLAAAGERSDAFEAALVPDPEAERWGYPQDLARQAQGSVINVAGLVGWREARVAELRTRYEAAEARWAEIVDVSTREEVAKLPPLGTPVPLGDGYEMRVLESLCDLALVRQLTDFPHGHSCFVRIHLRNTTDAAVRWGFSGGPFDAVELIMADGKSVELSPFYAVMPDGRRVSDAPKVGAPPATVEIAAGATIELGLWNGYDEIALEDARLMRTPAQRVRLR